MAIIPCPNCGNNISSEAFACPACNAKLNSIEAASPKKTVSKDYSKYTADKDYVAFFTTIGFVVLLLIILNIIINNSEKGIEASKSDNLQERSNNTPVIPNKEPADKIDKPCLGDKECIYAVRKKCQELNYEIMGEEYLGNGRIGVSVIDFTRPSILWNITFFTSCNCEILNVSAKRVHE